MPNKDRGGHSDHNKNYVLDTTEPSYIKNKIFFQTLMTEFNFTQFYVIDATYALFITWDRAMSLLPFYSMIQGCRNAKATYCGYIKALIYDVDRPRRGWMQQKWPLLLMH